MRDILSNISFTELKFRQNNDVKFYGKKIYDIYVLFIGESRTKCNRKQQLDKSLKVLHLKESEKVICPAHDLLRIIITCKNKQQCNKIAKQTNLKLLLNIRD